MHYILNAVIFISCLTYGDSHEDIYDEHSVHTIDERLISTRRALITRLDECTSWMNDIEEGERNTLQRLLVKGHFELFRHRAIKAAREVSPEDEECLKSSHFLIKKYNRMLDLKKRYLGSEDGIHIEQFLTPRQLNELHGIYRKTGRRKEIEYALDRFFTGMSPNKKEELIKEFFAYKTDLRRRPRKVNEPSTTEVENAKQAPEPLKKEWLSWQSVRNKIVISRLQQNGADSWEIMKVIGDQFYNLRKNLRVKYDAQLKDYCRHNIIQLIGPEKFDILKGLYMDNVPVDQIETRYQDFIGDIANETDREIADHYGVFCRKIFRLVHFKPADLTSWLTSRQKLILGTMIQDQKVGDAQVYDKVYDLYISAQGEQKEEAQETIDTGCRDFIAHMFGDETAEEFEDLRLAGNISAQLLAARLMKHASEIDSEKLRRRAQQSLPICARIYLNYDGSCQCYEHSEICDPFTFTCTNCTGFTQGVQCERCDDGYTGNPLIEECTLIVQETDEGDKEESVCDCNGHSTECDSTGICNNCQHNTEGENCERCSPGFYGSALQGTWEDCTACPCPDQGECFVNESELVQCRKCPVGTKGITCEQKINEEASSESEEVAETKRGRSRRSKKYLYYEDSY